MDKIRVYELARELDTNSKRLMEKLAEIGIVVKNHMSLLEDNELDSLYKHIGIKAKTQEPPRAESAHRTHEQAKPGEQPPVGQAPQKIEKPTADAPGAAVTTGAAGAAGTAGKAGAAGTAEAPAAQAARKKAAQEKSAAEAGAGSGAGAGSAAAASAATASAATAAATAGAGAAATAGATAAASAGARPKAAAKDAGGPAPAGKSAKDAKEPAAARAAKEAGHPAGTAAKPGAAAKDARESAGAAKNGRDARSAPRIIRTTEINLDRASGDDRRNGVRQPIPGVQTGAGRFADRPRQDGGRGRDRDRRRQGQGYERSEYLRATDSNAGLIAGFTRMTREESMKQLLAEARAQKKRIAAAESAAAKDMPQKPDAAAMAERAARIDRLTRIDSAARTEISAAQESVAGADAAAPGLHADGEQIRGGQEPGVISAPAHEFEIIAARDAEAAQTQPLPDTQVGLIDAQPVDDVKTARKDVTPKAVTQPVKIEVLIETETEARRGAEDGREAAAGRGARPQAAAPDIAEPAAPKADGVETIAAGAAAAHKPTIKPEGAAGAADAGRIDSPGRGGDAGRRDDAAKREDTGRRDETGRREERIRRDETARVDGAKRPATGEQRAAGERAAATGDRAQAAGDRAVARQDTARQSASPRADAARPQDGRSRPRASFDGRAYQQDQGRTGQADSGPRGAESGRQQDQRGQPRASASGRPGQGEQGAARRDGRQTGGDRQGAPGDGRFYQPREERPGQAGGDRPFRARDDRTGAQRDSRPYQSGGDRPYQSGGDRPFRPRDDRPGAQRDSRPYQPGGDRPYQPGGSRPYQSGGDRSGSQRDSRPYQSGGDRPYQPGGSRPYQSGGDRPFRPSGDRPFQSGGDRQFQSGRPAGPAGDRRPGGARTFGAGAAKTETFGKSDDASSSKNEQKREHLVKDAAKEVKKDLRREAAKPQPAAAAASKSRKYRASTPSIVGEKKGVHVFTDDEFIISEFYDSSDESKKSRRQQRQRKLLRKDKYIPPRAVLTSVTIAENLTVKELAEALKKTAGDVIKKLIGMGMAATINEVLDFDTAALIAGEFGIAAEKEVVINEEDILFDESDADDEGLETRPPVVVVMGHVDHGKTSLLDAIRKTNVTSGEAGGITQHIGAYMVNIGGRAITFLDTPGHEAFTSMRARGAMVTDIAILVVSAVDGVMPQTVEAINHARAANVSVIIAINMIDREGANPERVKQELTEHNIVVEEWGGDVIAVPVSAKTGENIAQLLEMVLLTADVLELKANPNRQAKGTVIEVKLDRNRGPVATLLVQRGTLRVGDSFITGATVGRVRAMLDDKGKNIVQAGPSTPVEIIGLSEMPDAGEVFYVTTDDKVTKSLAEKRRLALREEQLRSSSRVTLDDLFSQIQEGKVKELNIIIKADVQGSVEAIRQSLEKLGNDEVRVNIIHSGVGAINESDVSLANVSNAIIIGFNVRPGGASVIEAAEIEGIDIRLYTVIYNAIEDIQAAMKGLLDPTFREVVLGHVEVRQIFRASGVGTIGGCYVLDGKIQRGNNVRILRDGIAIYDGKLASLRRFKDDTREVMQGFECGIAIERFNDIKENDIIEPYMMEEIPVV